RRQCAQRSARSPLACPRDTGRMPTRRAPRGSGSPRTPNDSTPGLRAIPGERGLQLRVLGVVLLGALQILGRVHGDPESLVAKAVELSLVGELGECRLLVVAALGQSRQRLVVEDVDACVHPVREPRRLAEACNPVAFLELDDAKLRNEWCDDDGRRAAVLAVR